MVELDLLTRVEHDLESAARLQAELPLACEKIGRCPEKLLGLRVDVGRLCERRYRKRCGHYQRKGTRATGEQCCNLPCRLRFHGSSADEKIRSPLASRMAEPISASSARRPCSPVRPGSQEL